MHLKLMDSGLFIVDDNDNYWTGYGFSKNQEDALTYKNYIVAKKELSNLIYLNNKIRKKPSVEFVGEVEIAVYGLKEVNPNSLKKFLEKSVIYYMNNNKFHDDAEVDININFKSLSVVSVESSGD